MKKTADSFLHWPAGTTVCDHQRGNRAAAALTAAEPLPDVRKIAVLRANGLGDFIFTLPALDALRRAYPEAEIVLLGKAWHRDFLSGRTMPVDRVVVVPAARGVSVGEHADEHAGELARFFDEMRDERFDLAFQLHGGGRYSNPIVKRLGARVTIGLKTPDAEPLDRWLPYIYYQPEVFRFLEVVALAGARAKDWEPQLAANLSWRLECSVCGTNTITGRCAHGASFVDWIDADEVAGAALELLALAH